MTASRDNQLVLATRSRLAEVTLLVGFCALAATSIAAHVLTRLGLFDAWAVIAIAVIASAAAAPFVRPAADRHETSDNSVARMALAIAAIAALSVAIFPSQELHGARDEGLYTIIAAVIAERGSVDMHNQAMALARSHFGPLISWNYPGIYSAVRYGLDGDFAEMIAQFNHLTPAVRAIAVDLFGIEHIWVSSAVIAGAAAAALVMCAGQITGAGWAGLAGLALVANAAFIYVSRSTFAETYTIAMILFAIVFGTRLLASGRTVFGVLAGLAAGLAMLSRVDGVLVAVPVAALAWACALDGRAGARSGLTWMLAIASAFLAVSWIDLHTFSQPYARDLVRVGYETSLVMAAGLLAMAWLGAAAAQPLATRPALAARLWTLARWGLILTVAATCLIFVQRYGASWFSDLEAAAEARKRLWGRYTRERMARELTWYVPLPLVLAALAGAWALARGAAPMRHAALVALGCAGLVIVATNIKIAPDHPWLSRRLLVLAVPYLLILAAVWLAAVHQSSRRFGTVAALIGIAILKVARDDALNGDGLPKQRAGIVAPKLCRKGGGVALNGIDCGDFVAVAVVTTAVIAATVIVRDIELTSTFRSGSNPGTVD